MTLAVSEPFKAPTVESVSVRVVPGLSIAEVNRRIDVLKQSLGREIEHSEISVLALAAPD